ncbi:MAG TPA: PcfJ domain-containing protein [Candidatus Faecousia intestinigallinarum]|nr:PcfJ domain-containing protein [Candidatus Faecousia intestinigallinarum]
MLWKKELLTIPTQPGMYQRAAFTELKRSGKILSIDFYKRTTDNEPCLRFFSDGKNYISYFDEAWTSRNPAYMIPSSRAAPHDSLTEVTEFLQLSYRCHDFLSAIDHFISDIRWETLRKRENVQNALREKHFAMYPALPENLPKYCEDRLFHAYLFLERLSPTGGRTAHCSHCGKTVLLPRAARSGEHRNCPQCGRPAICRGIWYRRAMEDHRTICIAHRVDGQLLLRWVKASRVLAPKEKTNYQFVHTAYNLFLETPKGIQSRCYIWIPGTYYLPARWWRGNIGEYCYHDAHVYTENLHEVFDQDFQAIFEQRPENISFVDILNNCKKVPITKYLLKMGLTHLADAAHRLAYNPDGHSFSTALGINGQLLPLYQRFNITVSEHRLLKDYGRWVSPDQFAAFRALHIQMYETTGNLLQNMSFQKFLHYFTKQKRLHPGVRTDRLLIAYRDYISMSQDMGIDLSRKSIRFPKDCLAAHNEITSIYQAKRSELENQRFAAAVEKLYASLPFTTFEKDGFCILLPQERDDLIREGQSLNHCVGNSSYYESHISGKTMICFVRKTADCHKPYFTMEVDMSSGKLLQLHGFKNQNAPKDVQQFVNAYLRALTSKKHRNAS